MKCSLAHRSSIGLLAIGLLAMPGFAAGGEVLRSENTTMSSFDLAWSLAPGSLENSVLSISQQNQDGTWNQVISTRDAAGSHAITRLEPGTAYTFQAELRRGVVSEVKRGGQDPQRLNLLLDGMTVVKLHASGTDDGISDDHGVWGSPVLVKEDGSRVPLGRLKPVVYTVGYSTPKAPHPITMKGKPYEGSFWAHADSLIQFELDDAYQRLEVWVGVDDVKWNKGSVLFSASATGPEPEVLQTLALKTVDYSLLSPGDTTYYVDAADGDDAAAGAKESRAWRSLVKVNSVRFAPGDQVLFKAGTRYFGQLRPFGSGAKGNPVTFGVYGNEKPIERYQVTGRALIDAKGEFMQSVLLENLSYVTVKDLEISNTPAERMPELKGIYAWAHDEGTVRGVTLSNLYVHDVMGSNNKGAGAGYGILWYNDGKEPKARFDGLVIEDCYLLRTDRNGICGGTAFWARSAWFPSHNVVIRGNLLEDIGGDGIVPIGSDGCLVEHNVIRGARRRCKDYAVGIWPWSADNTLIQYNEVSGVKGTKDGQGFDSDWNCRGTIFQFNYSHDNDGGFMLICNEGGHAASENVGNVNTIVRYNISQNDRERTIQISGEPKNTLIHNNVFFVHVDDDIQGYSFNPWPNVWAESTRIFNNIFYVKGKVTHHWGKATNTQVGSNVYYGEVSNLKEADQDLRDDPLFVNPGSGGNGIDTLDGYRLRPDSPYIRAGVPVKDHGGRDFWGNPLPTDGALTIGAFEPGKIQ